MESADETVFIVLLVVNLAAGVGCAFPLARVLGTVIGGSTSLFRNMAGLMILYCIESVSMILGMGVPLFSVLLAFLWGALFWRRLRTRSSVRAILQTTFFLSLYTCIPAVSFVTVPLVAWFDGKNIFGLEEAVLFGIPEFPPLLWPVGTILGFYVALAVGAIVFKMIITTGEVSLLIHLTEHCSSGPPSKIAVHKEQ
jgi:hypothetical protein